MTFSKALLTALVVFCYFCSYSNAQIVSIPIPGSPLSLNVVANPQPLQELKNNPLATNVTMGDDSNVAVPLGFTFPYFNQNFNMSWMYSNGAVSFQSGNAPGGFCCSGLPLTTQLSSGYNYSILPLWTDLIGTSGNNHYKLGTPTSMTYGWYGVKEYGTNNLSSFELKIDNTGAIDMRYAGAFVSMNHDVTIGMIGNAAAGEFYQHYYGSGINIGATQLSFISDPCVSNPLYSATCPGYQQAYLQQQCTISQLYSPMCPSYQEAYFEQQCLLNPLYNSMCIGYKEAMALKINSENQTQQVQTQVQVTQTAEIFQPAVSASPAQVTATVQLVSPAASSPAATTSSEPQSKEPTVSKTQTSKPTTQTIVTKVIASQTKEEKENETKNSAFAAVNIIPGFSAYSVAIKDAPFYKPFEIYKNQQNVDNRNALRGLYGPSENRYDTMINQQYKER